MYTKTVKIVVLYSFSLQYIPDFDKKLLPLEILTLIFSNQGENTLLKTAASQPYWCLFVSKFHHSSYD